jgi:CTP:molybdopterin cytidylyltransferase MocA
MLTSSHSRVVMLIMTGSGEGSEVERMVAQARQAITLDIVDKALTVEAVERVIVSTNSCSLAEKLRGKPVCIELDAPGEEFHFGRQLLALINKHKIEKLFYVGGGSGPLLSAEEIGHIAEDLLSADQLLIANNFYSTDFAAFTPASVLKDADPPAFDNDLGWLLGETLGLPIRELPRTAATQLDVDTPMDLMPLQLHPAAGRHLQRYLEGLDLDISYLAGAIKFFTDREAMVVVAGRVSAATWTYLESETACQVRLFAEERGMRASGRQTRAEVRSLLGFYLDEVGVERFFATLSTLGQAAFIDSRVIFAHRGLWPPAADRFYSDLRQPEKIADPFVRHFTEAAMQAPIPVVLGGHSLVAGGLYALIEAAWARGKDLPRHIVPQLGI